MGRKRKPETLARTASIHIRCAKAYREEVDATAEQGGYPDVTAMFEAMLIRERKRLGRKGPPPPR